MLEFLTLQPQAFGLDISDLSLKIVQLQRRRKVLDLVSFGEYPVKSGILKGGEIKKEEELVDIIKTSVGKVRGQSIKTKYVIASLPEEKAFLQVIQMPRMPEKDLKSAVIYEAENYIPIPIEEVYLDSQVIAPIDHLKDLEVLIAAIPRKIVDSYTFCLKKAGFRPLALEIESLAIARALIKDEVSTSPILLIDLGATRTGFIIFSGRSVRFTSSIPVSSQIFTENISKSLKVSIPEAEALKIKYGLGKKGRGEEIFEALVPALTDLIQQIERCITYYQTHALEEHLPLESREIGKIILVGGGANLQGLDSILAESLKISVEVGNPWVNVPFDIKKIESRLPSRKALGYVTALGLALRAVKK